jgi:hypothetical protein
MVITGNQVVRFSDIVVSTFRDSMRGRLNLIALPAERIALLPLRLSQPQSGLFFIPNGSPAAKAGRFS